MRYRNLSIALEFDTEQAPLLHEHATAVAPHAAINLVHVVELGAGHSSAAFDAPLLEQEYYRSEAQLAEWGEKWHVPPERRTMLVGPVTRRIASYILVANIDLLVLGVADDTAAQRVQLDVVAGCLRTVDCDLLVVNWAQAPSPGSSGVLSSSANTHGRPITR